MNINQCWPSLLNTTWTSINKPTHWFLSVFETRYTGELCNACCNYYFFFCDTLLKIFFYRVQLLKAALHFCQFMLTPLTFYYLVYFWNVTNDKIIAPYAKCHSVLSSFSPVTFYQNHSTTLEKLLAFRYHSKDFVLLFII